MLQIYYETCILNWKVAMRLTFSNLLVTVYKLITKISLHHTTLQSHYSSSLTIVYLFLLGASFLNADSGGVVGVFTCFPVTCGISLLVMSGP